MALLAGTVAVADSGVATGGGLALAIFNVDAADLDPNTLPEDVKGIAHMAFARTTYPGSNLFVAVASLTPSEKTAAETAYLLSTYRPAIVEALRKAGTRAEGLAAAIIDHFAARADVRIPAGSLDSGSPTITRVIAGAVE